MCSCDFEANQTKIKGSCQSGRKVITHDSMSDLPLADPKNIPTLFAHFFSSFLPVFRHCVHGTGISELLQVIMLMKLKQCVEYYIVVPR